MNIEERLESRQTALSKVLNEIQKTHSKEYEEAIRRWWVKDTNGMTDIKVGSYTIKMPVNLVEKVGFGLTLKFLKSFPIVEITEDIGDIGDAIQFLIQSFASTAYASSTVTKENILALLLIKINTIKTIDESKNVKTSISTITCGRLDEEDYVKLANKSEDIDITVFFEGFNEKDKPEIGIQLARNGIAHKKENKDKWLKLSTSSGKALDIYFAASDDEKSNNYLTHGRCAIVTARETAAILVKYDDMPALGLNIGWHGLINESTISDINKFLLENKLPAVSAESLMMASIPKVKPNICLKLNHSEKYIMITFHVINDAFNSSKRKDGKFEASFTSDIYSKLLNMNFEPDGNKVLDMVKLCLPKCYLNMRHKGALPRELVGIIKKIVKSFESWKLLTKKTAATLV
jgi:hypothetical protein